MASYRFQLYVLFFFPSIQPKAAFERNGIGIYPEDFVRHLIASMLRSALLSYNHFSNHPKKKPSEEGPFYEYLNDVFEDHRTSIGCGSVRSTNLIREMILLLDHASRTQMSFSKNSNGIDSRLPVGGGKGFQT
jgi:hypothetical protein